MSALAACVSRNGGYSSCRWSRLCVTQVTHRRSVLCGRLVAVVLLSVEWACFVQQSCVAALWKRWHEWLLAEVVPCTKSGWQPCAQCDAVTCHMCCSACLAALQQCTQTSSSSRLGWWRACKCASAHNLEALLEALLCMHTCLKWHLGRGLTSIWQVCSCLAGVCCFAFVLRSFWWCP